MTYDFQRSIAQKDVRFITQVVPVAVVGENYGRVMIFVGESEAATFFVTPPGVDTITEVRATDYADIVSGLLKTWLAGFFKHGTATSVFLVTYTDTAGPLFSDVDMAVQFEKYTERAYFKLAIHSTFNIDAQLALSALCAGDPLLSFCFYGSHDSSMLIGASGNDAEELLTGGHDAMIYYHPDVTINPALNQLGETLLVPNSEGICVGNKLDFLAFADFSASGTAGANLTAVEEAMLRSLKVAFFTTVGNGTGQVVAEGKETLLGVVIGGEWVREYVDFTAAVDTATMITQFADSGFKNNETYQGVLLILNTKLSIFDRIGRFTDIKITAPSFSKLPRPPGTRSSSRRHGRRSTSTTPVR